MLSVVVGKYVETSRFLVGLLTISIYICENGVYLQPN